MDTALVVLTVFGVVALAELPDKSAVVALVLGARYPPLAVWCGIAAAFVVHVAVAVALGGLVASLPRRPVEAASAALFLVGAVLLLRSDPAAALAEGEAEADAVEERAPRSGRRVAAGSFGVVLVAELGDLTQVLTATLAARYDAPLAVGAGALLALWTVAGVAVVSGRRLLRVVPLRRVQQVAAAALVALSVWSLGNALT